MTPDQIERLAIDWAAGELNDDARLLFEAYLSEHSEAAAWAEPMLSTYRLTAEAVTAKTSRPEGSLQARPGTLRFARRFDWLGMVRWAAVIAIAFSLGAMVARRPIRYHTGETRLVASQSPVPTSPWWKNAMQVEGDSFWRTKAVATLQQRPPAETSGDSFAGLWDQYRRYRKEKTHD